MRSRRAGGARKQEQASVLSQGSWDGRLFYFIRLEKGRTSFTDSGNHLLFRDLHMLAAVGVIVFLPEFSLHLRQLLFQNFLVLLPACRRDFLFQL